jgi:mono/diheme cytochrome c family protein
MPRWTINLLFLGALLTLIPLTLIAKHRLAPRGDRTRLSVIPDMDKQPRFSAQEPNALFADGRSSRNEPTGTVARGTLMADDHLFRGRKGENWATDFPMALDTDFLARGRERYEIFCAPCHGYSGHGDGMVNERAMALAEGTWIPPTNLHDQIVRERPVGHLYNSIAEGIRRMPAYGPQIATEDRWAIVAYLRALQLSQNASIDDVPAEQRDLLQ